jgi:enterochelin esterase-like enzyme
LLISKTGPTESEKSAAGKWLQGTTVQSQRVTNEFYRLHNCVQTNFEKKNLNTYYQIYTGINRPELEADHSLASNAEQIL